MSSLLVMIKRYLQEWMLRKLSAILDNTVPSSGELSHIEELGPSLLVSRMGGGEKIVMITTENRILSNIR